MNNYIKLLKQFVRFTSVSTSKDYSADIKATVKWLKTTFTSNGFKTRVINGYDNPIVLAKYKAGDDKETALIYGHYDVQPANRAEGWASDPFKLTESKGRLYARGVVDNKGQVLIHMASAFDLIKNGQLAYNLIFMLEGNEESGSPKMPAFIKQYQADLKADFALISDGELNDDRPTIEAGYRGGFNCSLTVSTSNVDLHSGIYGGVAPSAAHELSTLLAKLYDSDNKITVDGFYDEVDLVPPTVKEHHSRRSFDTSKYYKVTGTSGLVNEKGIDPHSQVGLRPSIQVTGLVGGYQGEGYRNSIPAQATAKINFRLVKSQQPKTVQQQFDAWVAKTLPVHANYKLDFADSHEGIKLALDNKFVHKAAADLKRIYKETPRVVYVGGGLPIVTLYSELLGLPCVMVPLANEDCAMHGANENFKISLIKKALAFSRHFLYTS